MHDGAARACRARQRQQRRARSSSRSSPATRRARLRIASRFSSGKPYTNVPSSSGWGAWRRNTSGTRRRRAAGSRPTCRPPSRPPRSAPALCALTLCGSASSATSQPAPPRRARRSRTSVAAPGQRRVHRPERLADVIDRGHADQLDLGMDEQAPDHLRKTGEGLLVGSKANFLFLIHNESVGSSFTSPRPFRVNAGAVYCYTLLPDGKTKYLSEVESGAEVLIVNKEGVSRQVVVGRSKIETRPLRLIKAEINGEHGSIILQNAETIRVVTKEGSLVSVTDLKVGNEILAHMLRQAGRHFGMEVDGVYSRKIKTLGFMLGRQIISFYLKVQYFKVCRICVADLFKIMLLNRNFVNQIVTGDCKIVLLEIPADSVQLTITSPPYRNAIDYNLHVSGKGQYFRGKTKIGTSTYLDDMSEIFNNYIYRATQEVGIVVL